ncbi:hypothetical protein H5P28_12060 [Ruficoccus amylovorans]|uniref:Uncharacterized protein n=1 Tax=Ruficoccus amylovorans TaxID=1804625 RepID=A0A842HEZ3_9BACT|nr:hypothetical protein [Ruficoccus amylovorans]MBC2594992.1 hypothetical protein [Ruficoccus amylovorans]
MLPVPVPVSTLSPAGPAPCEERMTLSLFLKTIHGVGEKDEPAISSAPTAPVAETRPAPAVPESTVPAETPVHSGIVSTAGGPSSVVAPVLPYPRLSSPLLDDTRLLMPIDMEAFGAPRALIDLPVSQTFQPPAPVIPSQATFEIKP